MSKLAAEIHAIPPDVLDGTAKCKVGTFMEKLDAEDHEAVTELLNSAVSNPAAHQILRHYGDFSLTTLKTHRGKRCSCFEREGPLLGPEALDSRRHFAQAAG